MHGWCWLIICPSRFQSHSAEILPTPSPKVAEQETGHAKSLTIMAIDQSLRPQRLDKNSVSASRTSSVIAIRAVQPSTKGSRRQGHRVGVQWGSRHVLEEAVQNDKSQPPEGHKLESVGCQLRSLEADRHSALVALTPYPPRCQEGHSSEKQGYAKRVMGNRKAAMVTGIAAAPPGAPQTLC